MVDVWEEMFGIDIEEGPQLGLVDISEKEGIWWVRQNMEKEEKIKKRRRNNEGKMTKRKRKGMNSPFIVAGLT